MSAWLYDIRQAIAASWRRPLFTALLVALLSMGIGAAVAMFSVLKLNAVVLRPVPYGDPQRLMWLWSIRADGTRAAFAMQEFGRRRASASAPFAPRSCCGPISRAWYWESVRH
jgi:putative ABC transport system permease protein